MQLSEHFSLEEATASQIAARLKIDNTPDVATIARMQALCRAVLEPLRAHFGLPIVVTSCYRCVELERALNWGGDNAKSPFALWCNSRVLPVDDASWTLYLVDKQHPKGEAADVKIPGVGLVEIADYIQADLPHDQVILEFGSWVHVSYRADSPNRRMALTIDHEGRHAGLLA